MLQELYLKSEFHLPKIYSYLLQLMKNAFYFMIKALSVLKAFKFFILTFLNIQKKGFDIKAEINFNVCDVTVWEAYDFMKRL